MGNAERATGGSGGFGRAEVGLPRTASGVRVGAGRRLGLMPLAFLAVACLFLGLGVGPAAAASTGGSSSPGAAVMALTSAADSQTGCRYVVPSLQSACAKAVSGEQNSGERPQYSLKLGDVWTHGDEALVRVVGTECGSTGSAGGTCQSNHDPSLKYANYSTYAGEYSAYVNGDGPFPFIFGCAKVGGRWYVMPLGNSFGPTTPPHAAESPGT
jgi:hypothetical protein